MEVCFVTSSTLNMAEEQKIKELSKKDLLIFGFNGLGLVSYKKELSGETEYFQDIAKLSKQLSTVIVCGCDTDTYGVFRHSAVIADNGKIVGVTDMVHSIDESEYVSGGAYKVYDTTAGKIGVVIGEDLFFPEVARVLSLCDADIIISVFPKIDNQMPQIMIRASAYANGVPTLLCAKNYACVSDIKGNITIAGGSDIINVTVKTEKNYHLISSRHRGIYKESGY